jgi:hypothetical protein
LFNPLVTSTAEDRSRMVGIARNYGRRGFAAAVLIGVAVALSGCALGLGEFSKTAAVPPTDNPYMKEAVLEDGSPVALKPAALVEEDAAPALAPTPAAAAAATVVPSDRYPNLNVVPPPQKGKLLTPDEKAKVIAELEGLARRQGVTMAKGSTAADKSCDGLSAEDLRKRMLQGQC